MELADLDRDERDALMHAWRYHLHVSRVRLTAEEVATLFEAELAYIPKPYDDWALTEEGDRLGRELFCASDPSSFQKSEGSADV